MDTKDMDTPLSQSSVTLKLEEIQKRCSELINSPDALELTLEEPVAEPKRSDDRYNPYRS